MTFRKDSRGQAKNTRALLRYNYCHPMFLLQSTHLKACNFIEWYTIYKREKKGQKANLILDTSLPFLHTFQFSSIFIRNRFRFSFVFVFSFLTRTGRTRSSPSPCSSLRRRRADQIRPPPPSNLRIPTPPSFTPLVLSDLPTLFPLSVVPC